MADGPRSPDQAEVRPVSRVQSLTSSLLRRLPFGRFSERFNFRESATPPVTFDPSLPAEELRKQYLAHSIPLEVMRSGHRSNRNQIGKDRDLTRALPRLFEPAFKIDSLRRDVLEDVGKYAGGDMKDAKEWVLSFLEKNSASIEDMIADENTEAWLARQAFDSVRIMMDGNKKQQSIALQILQKHPDRVVGLLDNDAISSFFAIDLAKMMESKNVGFANASRQIIGQVITSKLTRGSQHQDIENGSAFLGGLLNGDYKKGHQYGEQVLLKMLGDVGLDPLKTVQTWQMGKYLQRAVPLNLPLVLEMNRDHPGGLAKLCQEYHLYNFGRYPKAVLAEMIKTDEDTSIPAFYVVYPRSDDEIFGQFYNQKFILDKLYKQLKGKVRIKIVEGETDEEIKRMLDNLKKKFGQGRAGILAGHGDKDAITFGKEGERNRLTSRHFLNGNVNEGVGLALKEAFVPGGNLGAFFL